MAVMNEYIYFESDLDLPVLFSAIQSLYTQLSNLSTFACVGGETQTYERSPRTVIFKMRPVLHPARESLDSEDSIETELNGLRGMTGLGALNVLLRTSSVFKREAPSCAARARNDAVWRTLRAVHTDCGKSQWRYFRRW